MRKKIVQIFGGKRGFPKKKGFGKNGSLQVSGELFFMDFSKIRKKKYKNTKEKHRKNTKDKIKKNTKEAIRKKKDHTKEKKTKGYQRRRAVRGRPNYQRAGTLP